MPAPRIAAESGIFGIVLTIGFFLVLALLAMLCFGGGAREGITPEDIARQRERNALGESGPIGAFGNSGN